MSLKSFQSAEDVNADAAASQQNTIGKQQKESPNDEEVDIIKVMLVLLLQTSDRVKSLESTSFYLHLGDQTSPIVVAGKNAYSAYLASIEGNRKNHGKGPPDVHIFQAMLEAATKLEYKPGMQQLIETAVAYLEQFNKMSLEDVCDAVTYCRIHKAFDSKKAKVQFAAPALLQFGNATTTVGSILSRMITSQGLARKYGKAPPGWMERQLANLLKQQAA